MALEDEIQSAAAKSKSVTVDGQSITRQSLPDLIEADQYLAAKAAAKRKGPGIKLNQLRNQGTT